jgi:hypothetical protein
MSRTFVERPVLLGPAQDQLGVITEPATRTEGAQGVLLMNAGLIPRVGPNRLNVTLARAAAAAGHVAIRLDLAGFGDSAAAAGGLRFEEGAVRDLRQAMDHLAATRGVTRFVAAGLCSGADVSLKLAAEDPRLAQAVLVDPFSYETRLFWLQGYAQRLLRRESWSSFLHGDSHLRHALGDRVRHALGLVHEAQEAAPAPEPWHQPEVGRIFQCVRDAVGHGTRLVLAYSGGPAYYNYVAHLRPGFLPFRREGRVVLERFSEADHTFTLSYHRALLVEAFTRWLAWRGELHPQDG